MSRPPEFREKDRIKMLLWCGRHCCLCKKAHGADIVIHHIDRNAGNSIRNGIPLCPNCHSAVGRAHGRYKPKELKALRNQVYEEHTRNLVPPILLRLIGPGMSDNRRAIRPLPFVATELKHCGDSLPVHVRVEAKVILGDKNLGLVRGTKGYYDGKTRWNVNPRTVFYGGFGIPPQCATSKEELKIETRIAVIDMFGREHKFLPQCFRYVREGKFWNLEPRSFTKWA